MAIPVVVDFQKVWNFCFWVVSHIFDFTFSPWDHYKIKSAPIFCNLSCGICANKWLGLALLRQKSTNWTIFMSEVSTLVLVMRNLWFLKMKSETFENDHFPSVSHFFTIKKVSLSSCNQQYRNGHVGVSVSQILLRHFTQ